LNSFSRRYSALVYAALQGHSSFNCIAATRLDLTD